MKQTLIIDLPSDPDLSGCYDPQDEIEEADMSPCCDKEIIQGICTNCKEAI